jgi:hypothetical protein
MGPQIEAWKEAQEKGEQMEQTAGQEKERCSYFGTFKGVERRCGNYPKEGLKTCGPHTPKNIDIAPPAGELVKEEEEAIPNVEDLLERLEQQEKKSWGTRRYLEEKIEELEAAFGQLEAKFNVLANSLHKMAEVESGLRPEEDQMFETQLTKDESPQCLTPEQVRKAKYLVMRLPGKEPKCIPLKEEWRVSILKWTSGHIRKFQSGKRREILRLAEVQDNKILVVFGPEIK